jgi:hypothetical protein
MTETIRGDIHVVAPPAGQPGDPRLCVVLHVEGLAVTVALVHTAPEDACELDAVIDPARSGTPYPLVVQTDLRAVVDRGQLRRRAGHLDVAVMTDIGALQPADGIRFGFGLCGIIDRRWDVKADEGRALRTLQRPW